MTYGLTMSVPYSIKKNSKLESFLKRALPRHVFEDIRYYESCVVKSPKKGLSFKYVVLTGKSVFLVDYPFGGLQEAVRLADVLSVRLEHDFIDFLKEPERNKCLHIRVNHKGKLHKGRKTPLNNVKEDDSEDVEEGPVNEQRTEESDICESEGARTDALLDDTIDVEDKKEDVYPANYYKKITEHPESAKSSKAETESCNSSPESRERSISSLLKRIQDGQKRIPSASHEISENRQGSSRSLVLEQTSSMSPPSRERSITSLLKRVQNDRPRVPRSYSSMETHATPSTLMLPLERRAQSVLDKPRSSSKPESSDCKVGGKLFEASMDLHIYVLHGRPILLNHLQACWCTQLINATLQTSEGILPPIDAGDILCLEGVYSQFKREIMNPKNTLDHFYHLLEELHHGLQQRIELKAIFWKDQILYYFLVQKLHSYMLKPKKSESSRGMEQGLDPDMVILARQDELEVTVLLLEIFLTSMRDTDNVPEKIQMLKFHKILRNLLKILVSPPFIPLMFSNTCTRMLEDFNEYSSDAWKNLPEAELISLVAEIVNAVGGILREIFITMKRLSEINPYVTIPLLFEDVNLECYIKRSLTQLLALLFPPRQKKLKPDESVLVYQHFFVLKCFMENLPRAQSYVEEHYQEEFRYYIHWSRVSSKMSERYPIKRVLQAIVDTVHRMGSCRKEGPTSSEFS